MSSAKAISHCRGKGSLRHNNRVFFSPNVDQSRTPNNITYVTEPLKDAYKACFGEAVEKYNESQKRADRRIEDYYGHLFGTQSMETPAKGANKQQSFYELVVQVGDRNDSGLASGDDFRLVTMCLDEYIKSFKKRNPNFYVFNAVLHLDEATPHLHIDYIPIAHFSRGLAVRNGHAKALEEMGFGNNEGSIDRWRMKERNVLERICNMRQIEIKKPEPSRGTVTVKEYKQQQALSATLERENAESKQRISEQSKIISDNDSVINTQKEKLRIVEQKLKQQIDEYIEIRGKAEKSAETQQAYVRQIERLEAEIDIVEKQTAEAKEELADAIEELAEKTKLINTADAVIKKMNTELNDLGRRSDQRADAIARADERLEARLKLGGEVDKLIADAQSEYMQSTTQARMQANTKINEVVVQANKVIDDNKVKIATVIEKVLAYLEPAFSGLTQKFNEAFKKILNQEPLPPLKVKPILAEEQPKPRSLADWEALAEEKRAAAQTLKNENDNNWEDENDNDLEDEWER